MAAETIRVRGLIVELVGKGVVRLRLPNGHRVHAHAPRRLREWAESLAAGECVLIEMSPFDMSKGRLVRELGDL